MRQTNKYMRGGTAIIIAAGLGLSSTALSSDTNTPVKEAAKTVFQQADALTLPKEDAQPFVKFAEAADLETPPARASKLASAFASSDDPAVIASLKLSPLAMNPEIEKEMNRRRFAVVAGELPETAITDWAGMRSNLVSVSLTHNGVHDAKLYDVQGAELAHAQKDARLASLKPILDNCIAQGQSTTGADYYEYSDPVTSLSYNVTCTPKPKTGQSELNVDEKIALLMADEDISFETRQARAVGMKARDMIAKFSASNPNPTRGEYYSECVKQNNVIRSIYRDDIDTPTGQAEIATDCEKQTSGKYGVNSQ
ncbi:hypothetical protein N9W89_06915 [Hellea sp.]|nr:hypothetical protein [Hellea sp.]